MPSYSKVTVRNYCNNHPELASGVYVDATATVIGQVHLAQDVSIWPMAALRGDVNKIRVGPRSNIQDASVIHVSRATPSNCNGHSTQIGADVTIAHRVTLHGCTIEDRVLVGIGAIVLDGAVIESDVIVGAGALVTPGKRLVSGYLYTGSPARQTRPLEKKEFNSIVETANNYVELKKQYMDI